MTEYTPEAFTSELEEPQQRFLSKVLQHTFEDGWKSPGDFLSYFSPQDIVTALQDADSVRVALLVAATGVHEKIALKKSIDSAGEDLQLALDENMVDPGDLLNEFPADARVRYLAPHQLWEFAVGTDFSDALAEEGAKRERAVARVSFIIETAIQEELLNLKEITDGMGFEALAQSLPKDVLQNVVCRALEAGRLGNAFDEELLLGVVSLQELIGFSDLSDVWSQVVLEKVADPANLLDEPIGAMKKEVRPSAPPPAPVVEAATSSTKSNGTGTIAKTKKRKAIRPSSPPPPAASAKGVASKPPEKPASVPPARPSATPDEPPKAASSSQPPTDEAALNAVVEELTRIKRLPPNYQEIPLTALCSIESMYADLAAADTEDERMEIIQEAFPNESMLRIAMLGLIQLLDSTVNVQDPVIADAEVSALVKIVLFEEKRRRNSKAPDAVEPSEAFSEISDADIEVEELPT